MLWLIRKNDAYAVYHFAFNQCIDHSYYILGYASYVNLASPTMCLVFV